MFLIATCYTKSETINVLASFFVCIEKSCIVLKDIQYLIQLAHFDTGKLDERAGQQISDETDKANHCI